MAERTTSDPHRMPEIRFYRPADPLRDLVTAYYVLDAPGPLTDFTHPEWANIRIVLSGDWLFAEVPDGVEQAGRKTTLFAATDRTKQFRTGGGQVLGIGLTPIGWLNLIGIDAATVANQVLPLGTLLGIKDDDLRARLIAAPDEAARVALLDALLTARIRPSGPYCDIARRVQAALMDSRAGDVAALTEAVGVEHRTLHRVCTGVFGFPPVRLLRRQRFLRTLSKVRDSLDQPLGSLIDEQYYDQAHFNRDFKAHMGMTPLAYFNLPREALRRATEERRRVLGASLQGLHPLD